MDKNEFALAPIMSRKKKRRIADKPDNAVVYFIENRQNGQVKIGRTIHMARRIAQVTGSKGADDGEYAILGYVTVSLEHAPRIESALHKEFSTQRVSGEWFNLSGQNLLDAAIRVSKAVAGDGFEIAGLATEAPHPGSAHGEANSGIYWKRNNGNGRGPRVF